MSTPITVQDIQKAVTEYLTGDITLSDLQDWFAPRAWDIDGDTSPVPGLLYSVQIRICEYATGHLPLDDFISELKKLVCENKMKICLLPVCYSVTNSTRWLSINYWCVGEYPLSYTVEECVEVFCDLVGWKLLSLYKKDGDIETYSLRVEMSSDEVTRRTIFNNYYDAADLGSPCSDTPTP